MSLNTARSPFAPKPQPQKKANAPLWAKQETGFEQEKETPRIQTVEKNLDEINSLWDELLTPKVEPVVPKDSFTSQTNKFETYQESKSQTVEYRVSETSVEIPKDGKIEIDFVKNEAIKESIKPQQVPERVPSQQTKAQSNSLSELTSYIDFSFFFGETAKAAKAFWNFNKDNGLLNLLKNDFLGLDQRAKKDQKEADNKKDKKPKPIFNSFVNLFKPSMPETRKAQLNNQRADVNRRLGLNEAFEGSVDENGNIRADLETLLTIQTRESEEERRKAERQKQMAMATKRVKKGPGVIFDLNKGAESQNSVTQLKG